MAARRRSQGPSRRSQGASERSRDPPNRRSQPRKRRSAFSGSVFGKGLIWRAFGKMEAGRRPIGDEFGSGQERLARKLASMPNPARLRRVLALSKTLVRPGAPSPVSRFPKYPGRPPFPRFCGRRRPPSGQGAPPLPSPGSVPGGGSGRFQRGHNPEPPSQAGHHLEFRLMAKAGFAIRWGIARQERAAPRPEVKVGFALRNSSPRAGPFSTIRGTECGFARREHESKNHHHTQKGRP